MTPPQVTIVILNWNGWRDTVDCIRSLRNLTYPEYHIILIDNGSTDDSIEKILPHLDSTIHFICNKENLGFAKASNQGITYAMENMGAEYVWLLNNDTRVAPNSLERMIVRPICDPTIGMVQPLMMRMGKHWTIDSTGHIISWGRVYDRGGGEPLCGQYTSSEDLIGCSGAAGLYRVSMLKEIGLLDESFITGYEDSEISWRAYKAGWKTAYEPDAVVDHRRGASMDRMGKQDPQFIEHLSRQAPRPCMMHGTAIQKASFVAGCLIDGAKSEAGKRMGRNIYGAYPYMISIKEMLR